MDAEVSKTEAAEEQDVVAPDENSYGPPPTKDADPKSVKADDDETIIKPTNNYGP